MSSWAAVMPIPVISSNRSTSREKGVITASIRALTASICAVSASTWSSIACSRNP
jgi:hypothetical protein